ncbi:P2X purinoceptor 7-like [Pocillopora verrucosa]|uniref:P2X purinoceptor 7-like n=1 Tax=Pocillopora verrucosa TaxID=203993 RepID=UPI0033427FD7
MSTKMDENIENSGEESDNDSILDLDLNPDGVIRPFMFEPQHSSSSGEEEISVDKETQEEIQEETSTRSRLGNREWCSYGNCQEMPTENECICCQEMDVLGDRLDLEGNKLQCITEHGSFGPVCLLADVLRTALVGMHQVRNDRLEDYPSNESMRLAGYRQFTWWTYNRLGKGNRRVIPSCVVASIRRNYPDAAGNYTGFKDAEDNDSWPG